MIAVCLFAAFAILCLVEAQQTVLTSLLLPDSLFYIGQSFKPPTFVGQVTVIRSTTYYTLDLGTGAAASHFIPGEVYSDGSYTFSEFSASTQYLAVK